MKVNGFLGGETRGCRARDWLLGGDLGEQVLRLQGASRGLTCWDLWRAVEAWMASSLSLFLILRFRVPDGPWKTNSFSKGTPPSPAVHSTRLKQITAVFYYNQMDTP